MANRSIVEAKYHGKAEVEIKNDAQIKEDGKPKNNNINTKIAANIPSNGTVTIRNNPNENSTTKIRVRRRTRIVRRA